MDETTTTAPTPPEQPQEPSVRDALVDKAHQLVAQARNGWELTKQDWAEWNRARKERSQQAHGQLDLEALERSQQAHAQHDLEALERVELAQDERAQDEFAQAAQAQVERAHVELAYVEQAPAAVVPVGETPRVEESPGAVRVEAQAGSEGEPQPASAEPTPESKARMRSGLFTKGDADAWRERLHRGARSLRVGWQRLGTRLRPIRPIFWRNRVGEAYWTVASTLSLVVNIILIVIVILLGRQLFFLKNQVVSQQLVNGLYDNFVLMDQAHIKTTITVSDTIQVKDTILVKDTIPVVFDLPLSQDTTVTLTKDTAVNGATIYLNNAPVPLDIVLPQGTELGIKLDLIVPVNQEVPVVLEVPVDLTVPVSLEVPVDIPLNQTELHKPFVGLQKVVAPFRDLLSELPSAWCQVCKGLLAPACSVLGFK